MIGQSIGHYRILDKLGEGGMGVVYLAEDTTLDRKVALKVLPEDLARNQERLERFEREARTLAALDHPNIVHIYTVEQDADVHFLTMQLIEGKRLSELIPQGGLPVEKILDIGIPLADALAAAHERGVIHRDLKPGNIMVTKEGRLKVLDFGLAKMAPVETPGDISEIPTEPLTQEGRVLGTIPYLSPEQLEGRVNVDPRSDIFSLGIILYELATGERPFKGRSSASVVSSIMKDIPAPVDSTRDDLPHHLGRVIRRCLEKEPDRRYQRARDLLHELEDLHRELVTEVSSQTVASPRSPGLSGIRRKVLWSLAALVLALMAVAVYLSTVGPSATPEPAQSQIRSIAVLPLTNLMNDPEQEYFVDGMTEAMITSLARIGDLKVISRTSAMQFKGTEEPLPEIARELDVDGLIEGSVLRSDGEVRITAQLIDGRTNQIVWVETFDRDLENVLAVHSEVARAVASEVQIALSPEEEGRLEAPRVNPAAQEALLKGRYFLNLLDIHRALEYFDRALEEDPTFAPALAEKATTFIGAAVYGATPPQLMYPEAERAAQEALKLDETLAPAHNALGWVRLWSDWDWLASQRHFQRAIELNPNDPQARWGYSNYLLVVRQPEKALAQAALARRLDPLSPIMQYAPLWHLYLARRYDEVLEQGRKALEMFPDFEFVHALMMGAYVQKGELVESLRELDKSDIEGGPWKLALQAVPDKGLEDSDFVGVWRAMVEIVAAESAQRFVSPTDIGRAYVYAQQPEQAIQWLGKAVETREPQAVYLSLDPCWDPVRADPRFQELVRSMNLPRSAVGPTSGKSEDGVAVGSDPVP